MMDIQKQSKVRKHVALSEWESKAAWGCQGTVARVGVRTCTRALCQRSLCAVPPTCAAAAALCSQQLVLQYFVIDYTTVLTLDINSREMSPAFSCSAESLLVWRLIPACSWGIVIAQVLQSMSLMP